MDLPSNLFQVVDNYYRPDLKKAALARLSVISKGLRVAKSGPKRRNRQAWFEESTTEWTFYFWKSLFWKFQTLLCRLKIFYGQMSVLLGTPTLLSFSHKNDIKNYFNIIFTGCWMCPSVQCVQESVVAGLDHNIVNPSSHIDHVIYMWKKECHIL